jgi:hypothetical protein
VEGDLLAGEVLEFTDQPTGSALGVQAVMEVGAEVDEAGLRIGEQAVGDGEDRVADGDQGAFGAASFHDPPVAGAQGKVLVLEAPMACGCQKVGHSLRAATSPREAPTQMIGGWRYDCSP